MAEPEMRGYAAAQREYENRTPPDDGPSECQHCTAGFKPSDEDHNDDVRCEVCAGTGWLDENGESFDPHAAEYAEQERADYERERRRDEMREDAFGSKV